MLVLFETPAGYSLFKVSNEKKLLKTDAEDIYEKFFKDVESAQKNIELVSFQAFQDTADAVSGATATMEGKVHASLKSFLKKKLKKASAPEMLAVAEPSLGVSIKEAGLPNLAKVAHDDRIKEVFRGIRCYMDELLNDEDAPQHISPEDIRAMQLGLSHSLGRYKLKFSADKVDTMVIQAVGLLDELDKEINTYAMRVKEWYGWHFPELQALVGDNVKYSKLVLLCGMREKFKESDLTNILEDEAQEAAIKDAAEISMGTEIAMLDQINIQALADQVLSMTEYRAQLYEYLRNRMNAIAPNLTILVGELVGARLISHAGSLMNLAKQPASTVQILGAEKALFRALKTKHDTPKYGLIYHSSLIGQAAPKNKGKISRVLAAKASLAIRVDALSDETQDELDTTIGYEGRAKVEARLRQLEGGVVTNGGLTAQKTAKYDPVAAKQASASSAPSYNTASDMVMDGNGKGGASDSDDDDDEAAKKKKKKDKKKKSRESMETVDSSKSKKKRKAEDSDSDGEEKKKKAKKAKKEKRKSGSD